MVFGEAGDLLGDGGGAPRWPAWQARPSRWRGGPCRCLEVLLPYDEVQRSLEQFMYLPLDHVHDRALRRPLTLRRRVARNRSADDRGVRSPPSGSKGALWFRILPHSTCLTLWSSGSRSTSPERVTGGAHSRRTGVHSSHSCTCAATTPSPALRPAWAYPSGLPTPPSPPSPACSPTVHPADLPLVSNH
jgi:hypothetical protein